MLKHSWQNLSNSILNDNYTLNYFFFALFYFLNKGIVHDLKYQEEKKEKKEEKKFGFRRMFAICFEDFMKIRYFDVIIWYI